jgi:hypothetical protein
MGERMNMNKMLLSRSVLAVLLFLYTAAGTAAQATHPSACGSSVYRQFDFWVGNWTVKSAANGRLAGTNIVTKELGDCVVMEHWSGVRGGRGYSFNSYDTPSQSWHQTWVDNTGGLLLLKGGLRDGSMVLEGTMQGPKHSVTLHRIVWTPQRNGTVRQHWTSSTNGGRTWQDQFDGIYQRKR